MPRTRRSRWGGVAIGVLCAGTVTGAVPAQGAAVRHVGTAKVISVDGPGRLTVATKQRKLRMRLIGIDTPQVGECGASESIAELTRLVGLRKRLGFRYELALRHDGGYSKDRDGRWLGWLSPVRVRWLDASLNADLVASEWARGGEAVRPDAPLRDLSEWSTTFSGDEPWGARPPRGIWSKCGGRMHLPAGDPTPATAPAGWTISSDGITESIGPLTLSPTLSPETALTVARVAALAPVELVTSDDSRCEGYVPSLQIVLWSTAPSRQQGCRDADVYAISSAGPGSLMTSRGVGVGTPAAEAKAAFPRVGEGGADDGFALTGPVPVAWAWRTVAGLDQAGAISGFRTTTMPATDE